MANLRPELDTAIHTALNVESLLALATGGVHSRQAPSGFEPPYVVFNPASNVGDYFSFTGRGNDAVYQVRAVVRSPWPKEAYAIDSQIDTLLQDATLSISGFTQLYCRRESDIDVPEDIDGVQYQNIGGLYRIMADE